MATYNNRHWLLSHIRNSFISTDDTGMSENVMSEDLPSQFVARVRKGSLDYMCYPGLDQSDDEDGFSVANSYDIQMNTDMNFHRQRSNTAHNLEKLKKARAKASRIISVKVEDKAIPPLQDEDKDSILRRQPVQPIGSSNKLRSKLSEALIGNPKQPQNKFIEYARFDGTAQTIGMPTRTMQIFLNMLPSHQRNYPMSVCVSMNAKVLDFIGLICYKCTLAYPEVPLKSVRHYGLYITEEDGELESDFPPLDVREPCSKFRFSHLALVERDVPLPGPSQHGTTATSVTIAAVPSNAHVPDYPRTLSMTSEMESVRHQALLTDEKARRLNLQQQQTRDLATMNCHTTAMEAPLYRSYRVQMIYMTFKKVEIQLGVSGEKIEIDPLQNKNHKFWSAKQKAVTHAITSIADAELVDVKPSRAIFQITYKTDKNLGFGSALNANSFDSGPRPRESTTMAGSGGGAAAFLGPADLEYRFNMARRKHLAPATSLSFKSYSFETDLKTAQEIVDKVKNILEVRSSVTRKEFLSYQEKKSRRKNRPKTNI